MPNLILHSVAASINIHVHHPRLGPTDGPNLGTQGPVHLHLLVLFIAALLLSSVLTHYVRNAALKRGWTCRSPRKRDVHANPIPRLGGVGICISFMVVVFVFAGFCRIRGVAAGFGMHTTFAILVPASLMFILGLYDDVRSLTPSVKFGVQIVAGLLLFCGGVRIYVFPILAGYHELNVAFSALLTVAWVLLISNAFNLIDGLDGLSAGSALFSTVVVFIVSIFSHNLLISVMTVILAGATLGFLRYNFNPATIFLGDSGSLFLGFMLSAVSLAGTQKSTTAVAVAIPVVSCGLPLLDTLLSVVRRFLSGQPLFGADREHIHHKLLKRGFTHKQAVVLLYGVSAVLGLVSLLLLYPTGSSVAIVLTVVGAGVWFGIQHLGYPEFAELGRAAKRTVDQRQIIVNNLAIRRATEELGSARNFDQVYQILRDAFEGNEFDGFDLSFRLRNPGYSPLPAIVRKGLSGCLMLAWRRSASPSNGDASWQLKMALPSSQKATFTVYRTQSARILFFDINMLTGEFQTVLANAVDRALTAAKAVELRSTCTGEGTRTHTTHTSLAEVSNLY